MLLLHALGSVAAHNSAFAKIFLYQIVAEIIEGVRIVFSDFISDVNNYENEYFHQNIFFISSWKMSVRVYRCSCCCYKNFLALIFIN